MLTERILLATDDHGEDIYSGFNEVNHPALDTKVRCCRKDILRKKSKSVEFIL